MKRILAGLAIIGLVFLAGWVRFITLAYNWEEPDSQAQAAVVLGTTAYVGGRLNQCLQARVDKAVLLYQNNKVKALIMTGGRDTPRSPSQAQILASLARYQGVDSADIWTENKSSDTWENIKYAAQIAKDNDWSQVFLVSEPYHLARALMIARHFGLKAYPAPAAKSRCWQNQPTRYMLLLRDFLAYWQDYWRIMNLTR